MRLFIDECLSPDYAIRLGALGHDAVHPLHIGRRGQSDHTVVAQCLAEDRVIVTENIGDFKALLACEPLHPGLVALPQRGREPTWALLLEAIGFIESRGDPMTIMVNTCLEYTHDAWIATSLPSGDKS